MSAILVTCRDAHDFHIDTNGGRCSLAESTLQIPCYTYVVGALSKEPPYALSSLREVLLSIQFRTYPVLYFVSPLYDRRDWRYCVLELIFKLPSPLVFLIPQYVRCR